tara:strand:- start:3402 stop:3578 length:177 start_codon:yes stop_codon:yes gene_type:complete
MTREMKRFIVLMISVLLFIIMLPLTLSVAVLKVLKGIINVIEQTLTFFISAVREEILK